MFIMPKNILIPVELSLPQRLFVFVHFNCLVAFILHLVKNDLKCIKNTLQKVQSVEKLSKYCIKALKSSLNIQKSLIKQSKELKLSSTRLLFIELPLHSRLLLNQNPTK